jgi:ATP-binding cassette subfamily C (CFTR/MRP) protein 1
LADQIVILGDARIQFQGTADDILHSSSQVLKTIIHDKQMKRDNHLDELEVKKLAQTTSKLDVALNVTRKTGDLAVYGKNEHFHTTSCDTDIYFPQAITLGMLVF